MLKTTHDSQYHGRLPHQRIVARRQLDLPRMGPHQCPLVPPSAALRISPPLRTLPTKRATAATAPRSPAHLHHLPHHHALMDVLSRCLTHSGHTNPPPHLHAPLRLQPDRTLTCLDPRRRVPHCRMDSARSYPRTRIRPRRTASLGPLAHLLHRHLPAAEIRRRTAGLHLLPVLNPAHQCRNRLTATTPTATPANAGNWNCSCFD